MSDSENTETKKRGGRAVEGKVSYKNWKNCWNLNKKKNQKKKLSIDLDGVYTEKASPFTGTQ